MAKESDALSVWDAFMAELSRHVRTLSLPRIRADAPNTIAMIEPRSHPHLATVLGNALRFLGPDWGVHLFCGRNNRGFAEELSADLGEVVIEMLDVDDLSVVEYNTLKKQPHIWRSISAENILWMEPDCILRRRGIEEYMEFDYIGAPWRPEFALSPSCQVGNGGLSFRKRSAMLRIAENANPSHRLILPEDAYFVLHMHMCNRLEPGAFRLPDPGVASSFAVESVFHPDPLGLHKTWRYLPLDQVRSLLGGLVP